MRLLPFLYERPSRIKLVIIGCAALLSIAAITVFIIQNAHKQPTIIISAAQLQEEINHTNTFYQSQKNSVNQETLRSDITRQLAKDSLVTRYAKEHKITVSSAEIDDLYQQKITAAETEQSLLNKLATQYGINKQQYLLTIQLDILKAKVQSDLNRPLNDWLNQELPRYRIVISKR